MLSGISIWQLLILLAIVLLVFGSKRLRNLGPDLGSALKGFRSAMKDDEDDKERKEQDDPKVVNHEHKDSTHQTHSRTTAHEDETTHDRRD